MDLNKMINDSLAKVEAEGYMETVIEKKVKGTLENIVSDLFSPYGDFGKDLKAAIKSQLHINLEELDICTYNVIVVNAINEHFRQTISNQGIEKLKEQMNHLLFDAKPEYKLSGLVEEMKDYAAGYNDDYRGKEISFHHLPGELNFIYFDPEECVESYACRYRLCVDKNGTAVSISIKDCKFDNQTIMGGLHGLDETLFKIYASGAKIVVDAENVDQEYDVEEGDD